MPDHDTVVAEIYARNRVLGYRMARHLGSRDPEDVVQDAAVILFRMPRIADSTADQNGLWNYCVGLARMRERRVAARRLRLGAAFPLSLIEADDNVDHPQSPSVEEVVLASVIEPTIVRALGRMMPSDRARFARRLADWKRHTEPFAPAIRALERHKEAS